MSAAVSHRHGPTSTSAHHRRSQGECRPGQQPGPALTVFQVKLCYICREEEHHDGPSPAVLALSPAAHRPTAPGRPSRAWTHPCRCTLVAHEACLLQWIQSSQQSRSRAPNALKCPQCGSPYVLESDNPLALRLLNLANASLSAMGKIVTVASFTVVVVSVGSGLPLLLVARSFSLFLSQGYTSSALPTVPTLSRSFSAPSSSSLDGLVVGRLTSRLTGCSTCCCPKTPPTGHGIASSTSPSSPSPSSSPDSKSGPPSLRSSPFCSHGPPPLPYGPTTTRGSCSVDGAVATSFVPFQIGHRHRSSSDSSSFLPSARPTNVSLESSLDGLSIQPSRPVKTCSAPSCVSTTKSPFCASGSTPTWTATTTTTTTVAVMCFLVVHNRT